MPKIAERSCEIPGPIPECREREPSMRRYHAGDPTGRSRFRSPTSADRRQQSWQGLRRFLVVVPEGRVCAVPMWAELRLQQQIRPRPSGWRRQRGLAANLGRQVSRVCAERAGLTARPVESLARRRRLSNSGHHRRASRTATGACEQVRHRQVLAQAARRADHPLAPARLAV